MTNNFVTSETRVPRKPEQQVTNLNQIGNHGSVAQRIEQKKQEGEKAVEDKPADVVDWGERGVLNNRNRGFQLLR